MKLNEASREFKITCNGGMRATSAATCAVLHQTGGSTARGAAQYLASRPDGSVHMIVDNVEAYQTAPVSRITCGVADVNSWTWHIEQAGPFSRTANEWRDDYARTIRRAAFWMAWFLLEQGLPARFLSTKSLNDGKRRGWTTHKSLSLSKLSSSTHTDPVNYPIALFTRDLADFYTDLKHNGPPKLVIVK